MEFATTCEISILDFWELTPRELNIYIKSYIKNKKESQEERLTLVYLGAVWESDRTKRLPDLKKLLEHEEKKEEMSAEEILDEIKKMNSAMGGTVY